MSGVYIPGMEMPKICYDCPLCVEQSDGDIDWHYECCLLHDHIGKSRVELLRIPACPLIPVPDHGRLIDADEFYTDINGSVLLTKGFKDIFNLWFDEQPTIIPADEEAEP